MTNVIVFHDKRYYFIVNEDPEFVFYKFRKTRLVILYYEFYWCGGVVVIRSPHDPEAPSSNPGKNNTSDFSIRDPSHFYLPIRWITSLYYRLFDRMYQVIKLQLF